MGFAARTMFAMLNRSCAITSYSGDYRQGGLVRVILPLAAHLAMQRGDLLHHTATPGGWRCPARTGRTPSPRAGRRRRHRRCACRAGGTASCAPWAVVRKWAMPLSIPVTAPVAGSGSAGTSSQARMTYHCLPSRLTLIVLTRPVTGRCWCTRTCPTPCRRTRVTGSCGVQSQRQPSPSLAELRPCRTSSRHGTGDSPASHRP